MISVRNTLIAPFVVVVVGLFSSKVMLAAEFQASSASVPAPREVTAPLAARMMALPNAERRYNLKESRLSDHHRPGPLEELPADVLALAPSPRMDPTSVTPTADLAAAPIELVTNTGLADTATNNGTSEVGEPSVGVRGAEAFVTGNWYASFSDDGGSTFSFVNPDTTFPDIPNQPFCCDQLALYDAAHDLMVWYLQYVHDDNGNTGRLAVAQGSDIANQQWRFYDFTPQDLGHDREWFDFPAVAVGERFLYLTTNMFTTVSPSFTRAVVLRLPLDQLAAYQGFNYDFFESTQDFSLRPTKGADDTMYFANHVTTNRIRVFTWPEDTTTLTSDEVTVDVWSNAQRVAPGPDGRDWLGRADHRITAGWMSGDEIGFSWTAAQDSNFPFPHARVVIMNKDTKAIVTQPHVWNPDFAYAYPAAAPNEDGVVGISVLYGGGSQFHPSHAVGILHSDNASWSLLATANGTHGPAANRAGDYVDAEQHGSDPKSWVATGLTQQGGTQRTDVEPRYIQFRLKAEMPPDDEVGLYEYAAKVVCGLQRDPSNTRLAQGFYATAVNIRNPNPDAVEFSKSLALTFPPEEQSGGEVTEISTDELDRGQALEADCMDLERELFPEGLPEGLIKGYLVIRSKVSLDVTAVYTSAALDQEGRAGAHSSIDVEHVPERRMQQR